jgi:hypothetical protein
MKTAVLVGVFAAFLATGAQARIRVTQDGQGRTTSISGLYADDTCSVRPLTGKVVKRDFEDDGTTLKGFVVERADGTREYINADAPTGLDMATSRAVYDGLQRLTKVGRRVTGKVLACGVAGAVMSVETIR